jgi:glutathione S-transferase
VSLTLYAHPFSSYCQKVLIPLYENGTPFVWRSLEDPAANQELAALWPMRRFPLLVDEGRVVVEATVIVEHLDVFHPGPTRFLPADPREALEVRMLDRFFDNYVMTPQGRVVFDALRPAADRDPTGVAEARRMLETAYAWLDARMAGREWAVGGGFTLADCAAAPSLFYADWTHPIPPVFGHLLAYRRRLLARPSFARAVDEARRFRPNFPLGAPDRD